MKHFSGKNVCVIGLGRSGKSAINLLLEKKAQVIAVDDSQDCLSLEEIRGYKDRGVKILTGPSNVMSIGLVDLAIVSPSIAHDHPLVQRLVASRTPIWSELELGWRESLCPSIAISGTNGKTTVTSWVKQILVGNGLRTIAAGNIGTPLSEVVTQNKNLNFFTLEVSSFQLEHVESFKPKIALLLNVAEDHLDRHCSLENYLRIKSRLFENQGTGDCVIIQWELLERLKQIDVPVPSPTLTFSECESNADLYIERNQVKCRMPNWPSTVLDLDHCNFQGSHNAANLMAALLVGKVLGMPIEKLIAIAAELQSGGHRCELVGEWNGVKFFNDSKSTNVHALTNALCSMPDNNGDPKNVWLIAGGQNKGVDFRGAKRELMQRVKSAYLIGQASIEMRSAWSSYVTCNLVGNMLEAVGEAGRNAVSGDVVLLSPACASFDMFDSYQHRGESFCAAVQSWMKTMVGD